MMQYPDYLITPNGDGTFTARPLDVKTVTSPKRDTAPIPTSDAKSPRPVATRRPAQVTAPNTTATLAALKARAKQMKKDGEFTLYAEPEPF